MKTPFLILSFLSMIMTAPAQGQPTQYACQLSHKHSERGFHLSEGEIKEVKIGGWKVIAGLKRNQKIIEVSLTRRVNVMDATYKREAKKAYPISANAYPVELSHSFGGRSDVFNMTCYPLKP